MSSSIWTQSGASSRIRPLTAEPWRIVEAQHRISTRKLVDSDAEQRLLEELLETAKPLAADDGRLHYLLSTPFRYPPLRHGSRFGTRWDRGIWYGSDAIHAAFAEVAYYRLLFLEGTEADLDGLETDLSAFRALVATKRALDLTRPWFDRWRGAIASKTSYAETQPFGGAMRDAAVEVCRYVSARDPDGTANLALLTPRVFTTRRPRALETWRSVASRDAVEFSKRDYFERRLFRFSRETFLVDGALPHPALPTAATDRASISGETPE
jgi:hypothetical protein